MQHAILKSYALLALIWLSAPTHAQAPITPLTALPPDYYQVIITNNLFRPLGWTKPKSEPVFELIATVMKTNSRLHKALIRNTRNRILYYVAVGELAGEAIVVKIEAHRVTLNHNGEPRVYRLPL